MTTPTAPQSPQGCQVHLIIYVPPGQQPDFSDALSNLYDRLLEHKGVTWESVFVVGRETTASYLADIEAAKDE